MRTAMCLLAAVVVFPGLTRAQQPVPPPAQEPKATTAKPAEAPPVAKVEPVEVVPDLPDFPGAIMVSYEEKGAHEAWAKTWKRETHVTAPQSDLRRFYLDTIEKKGWKISGVKEKPGQIEWSLIKGSSWGQIEIDAEKAGIVKVMVERRDR